MEDVNRIKLVLVEKKRTNKWLSDQMGVTPSTVSKWCTNSSQPDLPSLLKIADLLEVDIKELIVREYKKFLVSQELTKKQELRARLLALCLARRKKTIAAYKTKELIENLKSSLPSIDDLEKTLSE